MIFRLENGIDAAETRTSGSNSEVGALGRTNENEGIYYVINPFSLCESLMEQHIT